jgi:hypothetical protein
MLIPDFTGIHRHFFSKATAEDGEELKDKVLCRVKVNGTRCFFAHKTNQSTEMRMRHLRSCHYEMLDELLEFRLHQNGGSPAQGSTTASTQQTTKAPARSQKAKEEQSRVADVIANAIAVDQLPMSILKGCLVQDMIRHYDPPGKVPSQEEIENALSIRCIKMTDNVKKLFVEHVTLGSFTTDGWKSNGGKKFLGLTFHYFQRDFTPRSVAIGMKRMEGSQTAEAIKFTIGMYVIVIKHYTFQDA